MVGDDDDIVVSPHKCMTVWETLNSALTSSRKITNLSYMCLSSFGDLAPHDGESQPGNPPTEVVKHRRLFSRGAVSRPKGYKVKNISRFPPSPPGCYLIQPGSSYIFGVKYI